MERNAASVRAADERLDALLGHRGAATVSLLFALSAGEELVPLLRAVETWCARRTGRVE